MKKIKALCIGAALAMAVTTIPNISFAGLNIQIGSVETYAATTTTLNSKSNTTLKRIIKG